MRNAQPRTLQFYRTPNGRVPFTEWFESLRDQKTRTRIRGRLTRLEVGNFGDCQSVGEAFLNYAFILVRDIEYILVKLETHLFCCSVAVTNHHSSETLNVQKHIGRITRRHNDEGT